MTSEREKQLKPREHCGNPWDDMAPWQPKPRRKMSMDWVAVVGVVWMMG